MASVHRPRPPVDPIRDLLDDICRSLCPPSNPLHLDSVEWEIYHAMAAEAAALRLGDDVVAAADDDWCLGCGAEIEPGPIPYCWSCLDDQVDLATPDDAYEIGGDL